MLNHELLSHVVEACAAMLDPQTHTLARQDSGVGPAIRLGDPGYRRRQPCLTHRLNFSRQFFYSVDGRAPTIWPERLTATIMAKHKMNSAAANSIFGIVTQTNPVPTNINGAPINSGAAGGLLRMQCIAGNGSDTKRETPNLLTLNFVSREHIPAKRPPASMKSCLAAVVAVFCLLGAAEAAPLPTGNSGVASRHAGDAGMASDSAVLFFDNFESYSGISGFWNSYQNFYQQSNFRIATEAANVFAGQKALEITQPSTSTAQYNALVKAVTPRDTLFVRFYTKLSAGFSFSSGDAVHNGINISGGYSGPGAVPNGRDFFYVGLESTTYRGEPQPGYLHSYVYHPEQRSGYGDHWYSDGMVIPGGTQGNFGTGFVPQPPRILDRDRWYSVELMVKLNAPGARDGRVAAWIDGNLIADWQNLRFRDVSTLKIDRVQLDLGAPKNTDGVDRVWIDNLVIASEYVGPLAGSAVPEPSLLLGLSVSPGSIAENGGVATGTVTRSGSTAGGLAVALTSSDTGEATVPASATIAAGANSATFQVRGVDDTVVDGTQKVTLKAIAPGATAATATLDVTDNDAPPPPPPTTASETIFSNLTAPPAHDGKAWVLGTTFKASRPGTITHVRLYTVAGESGSHTFRLWNNAAGAQVGAAQSFSTSGSGWKQIALTSPIRIQSGVNYTVAVTTGGDAGKYYAAAVGALNLPSSNGASLSYPANAGVFGTTLTARPTQSWNASNYLRDVVFVPD